MTISELRLRHGVKQAPLTCTHCEGCAFRTKVLWEHEDEKLCTRCVLVRLVGEKAKLAGTVDLRVKKKRGVA